MTIDNVTLFWAFFLMSIGLMGAMIAFMYFADSRARERKSPTK